MSNRLIVGVLAVLANTFAPFAISSPISVQDQADRSVVLGKPADSLVTTYSPANLLIMPLGAAHKVVGIGGSTAHSPLMHRFFAPYNPIQVGSRSAGINLETLISLQPDLVIFHGKKDGVRLANKLSAMGVSTLVLQPETLDEVKQALRLLGQTLGESSRAETVIGTMDRMQSLVDQRLADLTPDDRLKGYYANGEDPFRTAGKTMFQHELISAAGLNNVAAEAQGFYPKINPEQVYLWAPQFVVAERARTQEANKASQPSSDAFLGQLPGITLPRGSFWDMPSPMAPAAILLIAANAYPERFADIDVKAEIADFYRQLLGLACLSPLEKHPCSAL